MKVVSLSFRQILVKFLYTVPSKLGVRTNFLKIQSWKLLIQIALHLYFSDFVRDWHSQEESYLFQDVGKKKTNGKQTLQKSKLAATIPKKKVKSSMWPKSGVYRGRGSDWSDIFGLSDCMHWAIHSSKQKHFMTEKNDSCIHSLACQKSM